MKSRATHLLQKSRSQERPKSSKSCAQICAPIWAYTFTLGFLTMKFGSKFGRQNVFVHFVCDWGFHSDFACPFVAGETQPSPARSSKLCPSFPESMRKRRHCCHYHCHHCHCHNCKSHKHDCQGVPMTIMTNLPRNNDIWYWVSQSLQTKG